MLKAAANNDIRSQLGVDAVSAVLYGHHAAASAPGNHRNGFAAVASQGEQECIQFFIIGIDALDNIFFTLLRVGQIHIHHLFS